MKLGILGIIFTILLSCIGFKSDCLASDQPVNYYRNSKAYGTLRDPDIPRYAKNSISGVLVGMDTRLRSEFWDNNFRRNRSGGDYPIYLRSRFYMGSHPGSDLLQFGLELQESRRFNTEFAPDDRDTNSFEFIQAHVTLYFKDFFEKNRPLSIRYGRMAFEVLDRRMIARNEWRNTTNTFTGFRGFLGQESNDWQLEWMALQPLARNLYSPDQPIEGVWFYSVIGHNRPYSQWVTFEPFVMMLDQAKTETQNKRQVYSPGVRAYGFLSSEFDFDMIATLQSGNDNGLAHKAFGGVLEVGYSWAHPWTPRFSMQYGYGSGDLSPNDLEHNRFERFFGFSRPFSFSDYFQWENLHAPKLRLEIIPMPKVNIDMGINAYWLASATDRWNVGGLRDRSGQSGTFIGSEIDFRCRFPASDTLAVNVGGAHFQSGEFIKSAGRGGDSNFLYLELTYTCNK